MSREFVFSSCIAEYLYGTVNEKRACGRKYDSEGLILQRFDKYCIEHNLKEPVITREFLSEWMCRRKSEGEMYCAKRTSVVKQLLLHMASLGLNVYLPSDYCHFPVHLTHILTPEELKEFFHVLDHFDQYTNGRYSRRLLLEYQVLFRMIYCCGLRNSECAGLPVKNINLVSGTVFIENSKGYKDRVVYLTDDMRILCEKYYENLLDILRFEPQWFFPSTDPLKPLPNTSVDQKFNDIWNNTSAAGAVIKKPTVHSLRFTFVVNRINSWVIDGEDINLMLPYLSRHLGHKTVKETFYYYYYVKEANQYVHEKDMLGNAVIPGVSE